MDADKEKVIESFDNISHIQNKLWNHNNHYYQRVLNMMKIKQGHILDIGCGDGDFLSLAIKENHSCIGVDFSPGMISKAQQNSELNDCELICGDIYDVLPCFLDDTFDAVFSFATMHHLDYEKLLPNLSRIMKKGSFFCIVDILKSSSLIDYLYNAVAIIPNIIKKRILYRDAWKEKEAKVLWDEHGKLDRYLTFLELKVIMDKLGYHYKLKRLLYFRYMLVVYF
jgi:Methylase involved in ubiquinone/menaquinone biosynthesis